MLNGSSELARTGDFSTVLTGSVHLGKYTNTASNTVDFLFDDYVSSDTGSFGSSANVKVDRLMPNGDGDTNQWTAGTGDSDWSSVSQVANSSGAIGITSYIQNTGSSSEQIALFNYEDRAARGISGAYLAIKALAYEQKTPGQVISPYLRVQVEEQYVDGGGLDSTSSATFTRALLLNTSHITAGAWSPAEIDNMQIGVKEDTLFQVKAYTIPLMVAYDANGVFNTPTPAPTYVPPTPAVPPYIKIHPGSTGFPDASFGGSGRHLLPGTPTVDIYRINSLANTSTDACLDDNPATGCTLRE
jgi:hypothetical protein